MMGVNGHGAIYGERQTAILGESGLHGPAPVGSFPLVASPYSVHDLAGKVYEWVSDWYQADYYKVSTLQNPKGPNSGDFRVLRLGRNWQINVVRLLGLVNRLLMEMRISVFASPKI